MKSDLLRSQMEFTNRTNCSLSSSNAQNLTSEYCRAWSSKHETRFPIGGPLKPFLYLA